MSLCMTCKKKQIVQWKNISGLKITSQTPRNAYQMITSLFRYSSCLMNNSKQIMEKNHLPDYYGLAFWDNLRHQIRHYSHFSKPSSLLVAFFLCLMTKCGFSIDANVCTLIYTILMTYFLRIYFSIQCIVSQLCELFNINDCCEIRWELMLWLKGCGVRSMNAFDRLQQQLII